MSDREQEAWDFVIDWMRHNRPPSANLSLMPGKSVIAAMLAYMDTKAEPISSLAPRPNCTTTMTFPALLAWLTRLMAGRWSWTANCQCKYIDLRIDTRSGVTSIIDRDGNSITPDELTYQYQRAR